MKQLTMSGCGKIQRLQFLKVVFLKQVPPSNRIIINHETYNTYTRQLRQTKLTKSTGESTGGIDFTIKESSSNAYLTICEGTSN